MWLPDPPDGTAACGGFDGSMNSDFTVIKLETPAGYIFTPRYGSDLHPTIWNPAEWGGVIPRGEIHAAWDELAERFRLERVYCDPGFHDESSWESEIERWDARHRGVAFVPWETNKLGRMYPALLRFESDLREGAVSQDGCPITTTHLGNARKIAKTADRYTVGKPSPMQKIDAGVTTVICHAAACDARNEGWGRTKRRNASVIVSGV